MSGALPRMFLRAWTSDRLCVIAIECRENLDHLRRMLMHEPRGFDGMYGALLVEKDLPEADMAVLFMHNEGMAL